MDKAALLSGLYVITDHIPETDRNPVIIAQAALEAGARIIQLREKYASARQLLSWARQIKELTQTRSALLIINDHVDIAMACGADGIHLGQDDLPAEEARKLLGSQAIIGVSAETDQEALEAEAAGANYLGIGPMFTTATKSDAGAPIGPERLRTIKQQVRIPVFGIGGINLTNFREVLEAGADGICVISAISRAPDIRAAVREFLS